MKNLWIVLTFFSLFFLVSCVEDDEEIAAGEPCSVPDEEACSANGDAILVCSDSSWEQKKSCDTNYGEYCQMTANGKLGCGGSGNNHDTGDTDSGTSDTGDNPDSDNSDTAPVQPDNDADTSDTGKTDNDTPQTDNDSDNLSPDNDADTPQTDNDTTELDEDTANPDNEITDNDSTVIDDEDTTEPDDDDTTVIDDDSDVPQPADEDADEDTDEDANADEDAPDEDATPADPCNPNPCAGKPNSTEVCSITEDGENYTCECVEGYEWKDTSSSCEQTNETICNGFGEEAKWTEDNKCIKTTTDDCAPFTDEHAVWNGETSYNQEYDFDNNTWREIETTYDEDEGTCHFKCKTNYFWKDGSCIRSLSLGEICTGQEKCYNASNGTSYTVTCSDETSGFFGQDAYYANDADPKTCTHQNFTTGTIIVDNNTGLEWTQKNEKKRWSEASSYCSDLEYGGKAKGYWRLPTPHELLTIVNNNISGLAVDDTVFSTMPSTSTPFWSSQNDGKGTKNFALNPYHGSVVLVSSGNQLNWFKCVHGNLPAGNFSSPQTITYNDVDYKIVTDSTTGLMWQKDYKVYSDATTKTTWQQALEYCEGLEYAGYTDWRLPNKNELASLLNFSKAEAPYSDFPEITSGLFWTSTSYVSTKGQAWRVDFSTGEISGNTKTGTTYSVICVRNAE